MATKPDPQQKFQGFDIPEQNWFKMPNEWTDLTEGITSLAELKVVEYVLKHTWGYQEYGIAKQITTDEFMNGRKRKDGTRIDRGTGLSKPSVVDGLKRAVNDGYLIEEVDDRDKARIKKSYALRMKSQSQGQTFTETGDPSGGKKLNPDVKNLNTGGKATLHRTEKDTLERHFKKDNNNSRDNSSEDKQDVVVALTEIGFSKSTAYRYASRYSRDRILEKIEFVRYIEKKEPGKIKDLPAWVRVAIRENYAPPAGYVSHEEREIQEAKRKLEIKEREAVIAAQSAESAAKLENQRQIREQQKRALEEQLKPSEELKNNWSASIGHVGATQSSIVRTMLEQNTDILGADNNHLVIWLEQSIFVDQVEKLMPAIYRLMAKKLNAAYADLTHEFKYPNGP